MLAAHGYFAVCVPYFGEVGLPPQLVEIPLEFFATAIQKILQHPAAVGSEVVFGGVSRGGEGSAIVGATYPHLIKALLSFVPASHVWEGEIDPFSTSKSAWTLNGLPLSHLPFDWGHFSANNAAPPLVATPTYQYSFGNASTTARAATRIQIKVFDGPVFIASGTDDAIWPSSDYADLMATALQGAGHPHAVVNFKAPQAGHLVFNPAYTPVPRTTVGVLEAGGTPESTARQNALMWKQLLNFLDAL
jgi:pimeloyl-ACP methyl ester carboxylesterase